MNPRRIRSALLICFLILGSALEAHAERWTLLFGLNGKWRFELGDDPRRAEASFDDSKWSDIQAPSPWEDQGYPGYDGYAWYRKHFRAGADWKDKAIVLRMGWIDDVDEVFVNGMSVGRTGSFPPDYETAYGVERTYLVPGSFLHIPGENVVAVRVYDDELGGGIMRGSLGLFEDEDALKPVIQLSGKWKFTTGDDSAWCRQSFDDAKWNSITVPGYWENQGYKEYDGLAWYRTKFRIAGDVANQKLILLLGQIDDLDETYVNSVLVGKTGKMRGQDERELGTEYLQLRAYTLPPGILKANQDNVVAVRVYDGFKDGGIYRGPIGIVTRDDYLQWQKRQKRRNGDFLDWLFR